MAKLKKEILGKVSGAVGDVLFRTVNGKTVVGTRPSSFTPGSDQASIERRQRFSMVTKLSRQINSSSQLRSLWKEVTPAGLYPYNMMVKTNYYNVQHDSVSDKVKLVPDIGFEVSVNEITLNESLLNVSLAEVTVTSGIDPAVELYFQIAGVLHLSNPLELQAENHAFMRLITNEQPLVLGTALDFEIQFLSQYSQLIAQYQDRKVFLVLLTLDINKRVVSYSNTFTS